MQQLTFTEHTDYVLWARDMDKHLIFTTNQGLSFS